MYSVFFDRGVCAWETVRGGGQDGWIHVLPLMVALGFTLFLRLPCREHSIFREVSEALDAGTLHADMQDPWFSQGFKGFCYTMFVCTRGTVAHGGRHAAPLGDAGFPLVFTRDSYRFACAPLGGVGAGPFPGRGQLRRFA